MSELVVDEKREPAHPIVDSVKGKIFLRMRSRQRNAHFARCIKLFYRFVTRRLEIKIPLFQHLPLNLASAIAYNATLT